MNEAFDYIRNNGGQATAKSYPYWAGKAGVSEGICRRGGFQVGAKLIDYKIIKEGDENALQVAVVEKVDNLVFLEKLIGLIL